jgi:hypothetical protein
MEVLYMSVNPSIIAATIAGGGIGTAVGVMTKAEQLEERGASGVDQVFQPMKSGLKTGIIGSGIGAGASGVAIALAGILRGK